MPGRYMLGCCTLRRLARCCALLYLAGCCTLLCRAVLGGLMAIDKLVVGGVARGFRKGAGYGGFCKGIHGDLRMNGREGRPSQGGPAYDHDAIGGGLRPWPRPCLVHSYKYGRVELFLEHLIQYVFLTRCNCYVV